MEHDLELIIARLEILEIEVCNILQNPGNIGKRIFWLSPILEILENWFFYFSHILEILEICFFYIFGFFPKKTPAEISCRTHRRMSRDLSYETDSGPKTKTGFHIVFRLFSHYFNIFWIWYLFYAHYRNDITKLASARVCFKEA